MDALRKDMFDAGVFLAHLNKTQPSEVYAFTEDDMREWVDKSVTIAKKMNSTK